MIRFNHSVFAVLALVATALIGTSCMDALSDQYELQDGLVKLIPFSVTASTPQDTKATVDYDQLLIFEDDDQLYIESIDGKLTGTLQIKSGGSALAKFEGTLTYTGTGEKPDPNLVLNARLISKKDKIGDKTFVGGIASKMTEAVSQFSTLTGTSTYEKKRFSLNQGTAFVEFVVTFDPAPADDFYDAELTISGGETSLGTAEVTVLGGKAKFALAFPGGTTLDRAKVKLCGTDFKFGGTGKTLEAAKIYKVNKTFNNDLNTPLTLEAALDGTITVNIPESLSPFSGIYYSINGATPVPTKGSDDEDPVIYKTTNIPVSAGDIVSFFGDNDRYSLSNKPEPDDLISVTITCSNPCYIYGNVMSLIRSSGFASLTSLSAEGALAGLFSGYMPDKYETREGGGGPDYTPNHLMNHPSRKLVLPATTLSPMCYACMFAGCTDLATAPELPANSVPESGYAAMFTDCTDLTDVPAIPATVFGKESCSYMFDECTSLVTAPAFTDNPNAQLGEHCFDYMYSRCTSLKNAPALPFTKLEEECYHGMFYGCKSLVTAPELNATEMKIGCYEKMFGECTGLVSAPALPAKNIENAECCYYEMFMECTSLKNAPIINAESICSSPDCFGYMFESCTSLETAPALPATVLSGSTGCYTYMFAGCTRLTQAPALPAESVPSGGYYGMFSGCTSLESAPNLNAMALGRECYSGMFSGCKSLTSAPQRLPATTLVWNCYSNMFNGCTSLTTAPELPATELVHGCYSNMFGKCTSLTTAPALMAAKLEDFCYSRMFYGCTNLNYINCQATDISANSCTESWVKNVAASGKFYRNPDMTGWDTSDSGIPVGWTIYPPMGDPDTATPLTFEAIADGAIIINLADGLSLSYSVNSGSPSSFSGSISIPVSGGETVVQLFGDNESCCVLDGEGEVDSETNIYCSGDCYIYGNFMSLIDSDGFATAITLTAPYTFSDLFDQDKEDNDHIINHPTRNIVLPATTLTPYCYCDLFSNCPNISRAPALPATTLAKGCYEKMFGGCALTEAPELPATNLADGCYLGMFSHCPITTGPTLPATTLAKECYANMFYGCENLTVAPALPAETLAESCYSEMFCKCIRLTVAPVLPAPVLEDDCYGYMFVDCSNLGRVTCLATDLKGGIGTSNWLSGVASSGTFVKKTGIDWPSGDSGIPAGWDVTEQ